MSTNDMILGALALVLLYMISIFNRLVNLRNRSKNAFAQIDVQLQRRYDLVPNLVKTAKAYMVHESETLEAVVVARNTAEAARQAIAAGGANSSIQSLIQAENGMGSALGKFFAVAENYPDLKANQTMGQLMEELTTTENKVGFSRQAYNDAVLAYNTYQEQFPSNMIAGMFAFTAATLFTVDDPAAKKAVLVNF